MSPGSSLRGTVFNLVNSMIGGGILALPFAVAQSGLILGTSLIGLVALLTDISAYFIVYVADATRTKSFDAMAEALYGPRCGTLLHVTVFLQTLGCCAGYVVILGDMLPSAMEFLDAPSFLRDRATVLLTVGATMLLPLACLKSMSALSCVSFLCLLMILIFTTALFSMGTGIIDVSLPSDGPPRLYPEGAVATLAQAPCILFAYICHMNIPILYGELRRQRLEGVVSKYTTKRGKMMMAMHVSVLICVSVYLIGAVGGYMAFKNRIAHDVLLNLKNDTFVLAPYIKMAYALVIVCSYPIMSFSCAESFHGLLWEAKVIGDTINVFDLMSPFSPRGFESPDSPSVPSPFRGQNVLESETHLLGPAPYDPVPKKVIKKPGDCLRYLEVACVVSTTLFIGIAVPDVSIVFGLTGGVCCSSLMYIFPSMFYLKVKRNESAYASGLELPPFAGDHGVDGFEGLGGRCIAHALFWGGLTIAIASTTVVILQTMSGR